MAWKQPPDEEGSDHPSPYHARSKQENKRSPMFPHVRLTISSKRLLRLEEDACLTDLGQFDTNCKDRESDNDPSDFQSDFPSNLIVCSAPCIRVEEI